jgi:hypothetical protein
MLAICQERGCKHEMYASLESLLKAGWFIDGIKRRCPCHHPTNPIQWPPIQETPKTPAPEKTLSKGVLVVEAAEILSPEGLRKIVTLPEASDKPEAVTPDEKKIKEPGKISSWFE